MVAVGAEVVEATVCDGVVETFSEVVVGRAVVVAEVVGAADVEAEEVGAADVEAEEVGAADVEAEEV
ncbi:hypothetical protein BKE56_027970, partial [Rhodococcus sp. M8]